MDCAQPLDGDSHVPRRCARRSEPISGGCDSPRNDRALPRGGRAGLPPRSFPRTSALWVHANASKDDRAPTRVSHQHPSSVAIRTYSAVSRSRSQVVDEPSHTPGIPRGLDLSAGSGSRIDGTLHQGQLAWACSSLHGGGSIPGTASRAAQRTTKETTRPTASNMVVEPNSSKSRIVGGQVPVWTSPSIGRKVAAGAQASAAAAAARHQVPGGRKGSRPAQRSRGQDAQRRGSVSPSEALAQVNIARP